MQMQIEKLNKQIGHEWKLRTHWDLDNTSSSGKQFKALETVDIDILITFKNGGKNKSNLSNNGDKEEEPIQPTQMNIF